MTRTTRISPTVWTIYAGNHAGVRCIGQIERVGKCRPYRYQRLGSSDKTWAKLQDAVDKLLEEVG